MNHDNQARIAFFDTKPYDKISFESENLSFGFQISFFESKLTRQTASLAAGFNVVCAFVNDTLDSDVLEILKSQGIKLIALRCAGYNNVDLKKAYRNIHVVRVPAYSPYAVAEHAAALMLTLNRKTHKAYNRTRDNNFSINGFLGFDMHGKTAGIIGTGKIGQKLISILKGFGMSILAYDKFPAQKLEIELGFRYTSLEEIYKNSDIITLHCPLNSETHHLVNESTISSMKKGVMLINTSRGGLIDTKALLKNLKTGKIGSAGLDVYEEESDYFFEDFSSQILDDDVLARLLTFPNVLITSHQAFFTKEALSNIAQTSLNNIQDFFQKDELPNEICYKCEADSCLKKSQGKCF
ncbi:MAG: 2-hydroxyacid dehydrogenase [Spirochaetales bacterium]|nr:2-hydroxyacid dehydrogenase [Spirochaetales bacterium]